MRRLLPTALAVVLTLAVAAPATAAPAITPSRVLGPPTTQLTLSGTGFGASEIVSILFDDVAVGRAVSNASGAFAAFSIKVPEWASPGSHWISAEGQRTHTAAARSFTVRTDWPQEGRVGAHTHYNPFENQLDTVTVRDVEEAWSVSTGGPPATLPEKSPSPVVSSGTVYVGGHAAARLYAFDAATGALRWSVATGGRVIGSPLVTGPLVIVGTDNGSVRAYSIAGHTLVWFANLGASSRPGLAAFGTRVYVTGGNRLRAYSRTCATGGASCAPIWSAAVPSPGLPPTPPAADADDVVAPSTGRLLGFDANCGTGGAVCPTLWTAATAEIDIPAAPALAGGYAYAGADGSVVYAWPVRCRGEASCSETWHGSVPGRIRSTPAVGRSQLHVPSYGGARVNVFEPAQCSEVGEACAETWYASIPNISVFAAAVTRSLLIAVGEHGAVYAFPTFCTSGGAGCAPIWRAAIPGAILSYPVVADGRIYVHATDGRLHMFERDTGANG